MPTEPPQAPERTPSGPPGASFLQVLGAVFASFFGIRKRAAGERDMGTIRPSHVILAGVLGAAMLVAVMLLVVSLVTRR